MLLVWCLAASVNESRFSDSFDATLISFGKLLQMFECTVKCVSQNSHKEWVLTRHKASQMYFRSFDSASIIFASVKNLAVNSFHSYNSPMTEFFPLRKIIHLIQITAH